MKDNQFKYKELIELGFKRDDYDDPVYSDINGFNPFHLTLDLFKKKEYHTLQWDRKTLTVDLLRCNKEGDILGRMKMINKLVLTETINWYGKNKKRS